VEAAIMSSEENKELVRATFQALDRIVESHELLYGSDWVGHFPGMPPLDAAGHRQFSEVMMAAFPDLDRKIEDLVAEGDKVVARWSAVGTHTGDFMGVPASGNVAKSSGITIFRIAGGRIVEEWSESDMLGLLQQVGAIPVGPPA
jgi:steroid delta-isomerase-like uncharacterized protein